MDERSGLYILMEMLVVVHKKFLSQDVSVVSVVYCDVSLLFHAFCNNAKEIGGS